jgi:hypothetical protein
MEIVVVSDGATDRTISIVQQFVSEKLRLIVIPQDGKWAGVTEAISRAKNEIPRLAGVSGFVDILARAAMPRQVGVKVQAKAMICF